jgi:hypothetical protein
MCAGAGMMKAETMKFAKDGVATLVMRELV